MDKLGNEMDVYEKWIARMQELHGTTNVQEDTTISTEQTTIHYDAERESRRERVLRETDLFERIKKQTFDNFVISNGELREAVPLCKEFMDSETAKCLMLLGNSGSGKTHLATAVCKGLYEKGLFVREVKYLKMVSDIRSLTLDYEGRIRELSKYKNPMVLYIDDLFKGKVTPMELKTTFEIIDHRYSNGKITIITSEKTLESMDTAGEGEAEAIKSRLLEMTEGYFYEFVKTGNFRDVVARNKQKNILKRLNSKQTDL